MLQDMLSLAQLFEKQVKQSPMAVACVHGDKKITYQTLNEEANQLAAYLRERGVGHETLVAINGTRSIECIIGILAIIKAGGAYVPLDPSNPPFRMGMILRDLQAKFILTTQTPNLFLQQTSAAIIRLDELPLKIKENSTENLPHENNKYGLAYILYTSGKTGKPKGVMIEEHSIINLVKEQPYINISQENSMMHVSNLAFDAAAFEIWGALLNGARLIIVDQSSLLNFSDFKYLLTQHTNTFCFLTSRLFEKMVTQDPEQFKGCEQIMFGGEECNSKIVRSYLAQQTTNLPKRLVYMYGPTECTTFSTYYDISAEEKDESIPIGQPLNNVTVYIMDPKLKSVEKGKLGELFIGGMGVARGYYNQPEETQLHFIEINGNRLYRTGDQVKITENDQISYHGRMDEQLIIDGFRVEPSEIEQLLHDVPDVEKSVVTMEQEKNGKQVLTAYLTISKKLIRLLYTGKCQVKWGDDQLTDVKVVDLSHGGICLSGINHKTVYKEKISILLPELLDEEVIGEVIWQSKKVLGVHFLEQIKKIDKYIDKHFKENCEIIPQHRNFTTILKKRLPDYMIPEKYIVLSNFPLLRNGKIDKDALRKIYESSNNAALSTSDKDDVQSVSEEIMMQLWREVLSVPNVSRDDNFFQLGGHSLLATKILSKLKKSYHATISIQDFFSNPMLSQLAILVGRDLDKSQYEPIVPVSRGNHAPLSFTQEMIWSYVQRLPNAALFNTGVIVRLSGEINNGHLQYALEKLKERHEILNTVYNIDSNGVAFQKVIVEQPLAFKSIEIKEKNLSEIEISDIAKKECEKPFELEKGPLFRVVHIRLNTDENVLVFNMHSSITDGWSLGVLGRDFSEYYNASFEKREPNLPILPIQFIDYAVWQRSELSTDKPYFIDLMSFWKKHLIDSSLNFTLPTDFARPKIMSYLVGRVQFTIDKKLTSSLRGLSINAQCTLYMTLFTAFYSLLSQISGKKDIIIGTPTANRNRTEVDNLIGCFANTLPIRVSSELNIPFSKLLQEVKRILVECYQHQDLPFSELVNGVSSSENAGLHPIFQVMFVMQNAIDKEFKLKENTVKQVKDIPLSHSLFELCMDLEEKDNEVEGYIQYPVDLFKEETIKLWNQKWLVLLQHISSNHQVKLNELGIL